ncbi:MAG: cyclic peptide export ABC transporter [Desulfobacterales bacterium]|nr:cyclic peptide export ABC transporter [Desulfobacterales bacterium]
MDFLTYLRNVSLKDTYLIIALSAISGITGGALLILYPSAAIHIFDPGRYLYYLIILPPISCLFLFAKRLSQQKTAVVIEQNLEDQVLSIVNTIRHDELPAFEKRKRTDIFMSIVNAQTITQAATKSIDSLEHHMTLIIGWFYIFFFLSPFFGWLILIWRLAIILLRDVFQKIIKSIVIEEMKEQKDLFTIFETHLFGFKELKLNQKKSDELFEKSFITGTEKIKHLRIKSSFYASEMMIFYVLSIFILLGSGAFLFSASVSRETILKITIMLLYMMKTDIMILSHVPSIMEGKIALDRLKQFFANTLIKNKDQTQFVPSQEPIKTVQSISIEDVRFTYPASDTETGFSVEIDQLTIKSGEIVFIVGGNGSGKSTLANLLTGLYRPHSGKVIIDDRLVQMAEHRYLFSTVFSNPHLFDSIYGIPDLDDAKVNELLKQTDLISKLNYRQGKLSTLNLSTGQKKRLALVIALLEDKPIYLFDEWAADQDSHFRRYFYEKLLPELKARGKVVIAITHDDHYFYVADQIISMDSGKIVERFCLGDPTRISHHFMGHAIPSASDEKDTTISDQRKRLLLRSRKKRKPADKEKQSKGLILLIKEMMNSYGELIKKLVFMMMLSSLSLVFIFIVILSAVHPKPDQSKDLLFMQFIVLVILYVFSFRILNNHFYSSVENRIAYFRTSVLDRVRKTSLQILEQIGQAKIYSKLTSDIKAIADASFSVLLCLFGANRTLMTLIYVAFLYFPVFLIMACLLFTGGMFYAYNHTLMLNIFTSLKEQEKHLYRAINDLLEGFKELRMNPKKSDDFYLKSIQYHASNLSKLKLQSSNYYTNNYTVAYALWEGMLLSLTLFLPFLSPPFGVLPISVAMVITIPLNQMIDRYSHFHMAYLSLQQLYQFEDDIKNMTPEEVIPKMTPEEWEKYEELRYENCSFMYKTRDDHPFHIGPLSLSFNKGEVVFLTGGNGSGKSTLLKIITGLYPTDSGQIFFNGIEVDIRQYQELFSAIFTDFYLFDSLYGMQTIDEAKLHMLLQRFQLDKKIDYINGKFSTLELSTGQKKRLALLITMMEDKPVYIFDEWAADQDPHFRKYFYETLLPEFKAQGKTVIAVTHDDRFFHAADRIIHIDYGQIKSIMK